MCVRLHTTDCNPFAIVGAIGHVCHTFASLPEPPSIPVAANTCGEDTIIHFYTIFALENPILNLGNTNGDKMAKYTPLQIGKIYHLFIEWIQSRISYVNSLQNLFKRLHFDRIFPHFYCGQGKYLHCFLWKSSINQGFPASCMMNWCFPPARIAGFWLRKESIWRSVGFYDAKKAAWK